MFNNGILTVQRRGFRLKKVLAGNFFDKKQTSFHYHKNKKGKPVTNGISGFMKTTSASVIIVCLLAILFAFANIMTANRMRESALKIYEHPYTTSNTAAILQSSMHDMKRFVETLLTTNFVNASKTRKLFAEKRYQPEVHKGKQSFGFVRLASFPATNTKKAHRLSERFF